MLQRLGVDLWAVFIKMFSQTLCSVGVIFKGYKLPLNLLCVLSPGSVCCVVFCVGGILMLSGVSLIKMMTYLDMNVAF